MLGKLNRSGVVTEPDQFVTAVDVYKPDVKEVTSTPGDWDPTKVSRDNYTATQNQAKLAAEKTKESIQESNTNLLEQATSGIEAYAKDKLDKAKAHVEDVKKEAGEYFDAGSNSIGLGDGATNSTFLSEGEEAAKELIKRDGMMGVVGNFDDSIYKIMSETTIGKTSDSLQNLAKDNIKQYVNTVKETVCIDDNFRDNDSLNSSILDMGLGMGMKGLIQCMQEMFNDPAAFAKTLANSASKLAAKGDFLSLSDAGNATQDKYLTQNNPGLMNTAMANYQPGFLNSGTVGTENDPELSLYNNLANEHTFITNTFSSLDMDWKGNPNVAKLDVFTSSNDDALDMWVSRPNSEEAHLAAVAHAHKDDYRAARANATRTQTYRDGSIGFALQQPGW